MTRTQPRRTRAVLLGWYGSDNTGDEAVLEAIVAALRKRGVSDLHALSIDPSRTTAVLGLPSSPRNPVNRETLRALKGAGALVLGGGGLIQDRTSLYNLPLYALYVLLAKLGGLKVVAWGLGVEPLCTRLGELLARYICKSADYFSVRDGVSRRLLVKAGVPPGQVIVSADPAFILQESEGVVKEGGPMIIFCLRDLPNNRPGLNLHYLVPISVRHKLRLGVGQGNARTGDFTHAIARAVRVCAVEFGGHVRFLSLWPGRDDGMIDGVIAAARRLGVPPEAMSRIEGKPTPGELAALVGGADLLVSMRLHALIFGARRGVPMLSLVYARKMRGLMRLLGAERWVVEVETRNPPPEELEMKLRQLWALRAAEARKLRSASTLAAQRAEADADSIARLLNGGRVLSAEC